MKQFKTKYGHFSDDGKEFIITTPRTPRPWANVVTNGDFGFIVSQTGSGYSWRSNAQLNRITRWEQDMIKDEWGKYLYVRDNDTEKFWSAAWKPVCAEPDEYEVRHGIGYTTIRSVTNGIETEIVMFVPNDAPVELWNVTVRNISRRARSLSLFTYFEWNLGAAPDWHREFHKCFLRTEYDSAHHAVFATKRLWEVPSQSGHWNRDWEYVAFHSSSLKPAGYDGDKESFMGMYGSERAPKAVVSKKMGRRTGDWLDAIGSLQLNLSLAPGASKEIIFTLGAAQSRTEAEQIMTEYHSASRVHEAFEAMQHRWNEMLGQSHVETPDPAMNIMLNTWLKYQSIAGRLWGRTGYYQTGGAYGFRDQLQDSQIFLPIDSVQTKKQILLHARHQFKDGTVYHWWHPLSEVGLPTEMTDDLLWLPYLVVQYLEETNDTEILKESESFLDDPAPASLYAHCTKAIEKVLSRVSDRGLPLIGAGDWNDGLSAVGLEWKGESIWLGQFLHRVLVDFSAVASEYGDAARASEFLSAASKLNRSINTHGWDGAYYFGATKDSGEKLGSAESQESKVWLNTQTWSVLGDVADAKRAKAVMDVVEDQLEFKAGPVLVYPAYKTPDTKIGYLTRYGAGMRENGGVYTHAATWAVMAEAKLDRADAAYRMFSKLNPINRGASPDEYTAEPYVTPGNIDGPDSRFYGRGGWTWYTGSAAWLFKAGFDWILGVRASKEGLVISPCIPKTWKEYRVKRIFRDTEYRIHVMNPKKVSSGIARVSVDGKDVTLQPRGARSIVLPTFTDRGVHDVIVVMG
ncbi:MAG TPA: glycosyl transferase family 36 [Bacteroidota bacterium]|nr:glycosyl transferase family 36 [Bacteroidota bacterium]